MGDTDGNREMAQDGKDITAAVMPSGGWGIRGWLSAIFKQLISEVVTIERAHKMIHNGKSFSVSDTVACDTNTCKWQITTPNTEIYSHLLFYLSCTGEATFLVTGGSDRVDGTALNEVNRRRVGTPATAGTIVTRTPTDGTTDGAVVLFNMRNGNTGVAGKSVEAGSGAATNEWILKPNTKYVISITTYASVYVSCKLDWYEVAD